jgi:DNA-damage-inducible protein J
MFCDPDSRSFGLAANFNGSETRLSTVGLAQQVWPPRLTSICAGDVDRASPLSFSALVATLGLQTEVCFMPATDVVRARIDRATKERAAEALAAMGLSISDAIRLLMLRVADERRLPFEVKVPNAATLKAMRELDAGKGRKAASAAALFKDLGI